MRLFEVRKTKKALTALFLLAALVIFLFWENNALEVTRLTVQSDRLPASFDGYRIVHLSDLHGKSFGKNQKNLLEQIKKAEPDLVVFTGDLADSRRYNPEPGVCLLARLGDIAPVYYVTGNHEWSSGKFAVLEKSLTETGVKVLRNTCEIINQAGAELWIVGIDDPSEYSDGQSEAKKTGDKIGEAVRGIKEDSFKILLAHRPEHFPLYAECGFALVLSGHAHGGQFRLPVVGGLVAPHQGIFPRYTAGKYTEGDSVMIVSRGLGNSLMPQRLFNRPEVVVITLRAAK